MRTQSIHVKCERLVSWTVMHIKALEVDKDQQRHSIEILRAGYIGRDENTMYPRQRSAVNIMDSYAYQGNRRWQGPTKALDRDLTRWIYRKR
jgi:hypothetical protein